MASPADSSQIAYQIDDGITFYVGSPDRGVVITSRDQFQIPLQQENTNIKSACQTMMVVPSESDSRPQNAPTLTRIENEVTNPMISNSTHLFLEPGPGYWPVVNDLTAPETYNNNTDLAQSFVHYQKEVRVQNVVSSVVPYSSQSSPRDFSNIHNFDNVEPTFINQSLSPSPNVNQFESYVNPDPERFYDALNYVNKIKKRFENQPDKYNKFLEVFHTYSMQLKNLKEGLPLSSNFLSEGEVYSQIAKLFENHEDLLQQFVMILPDANDAINQACEIEVETTKTVEMRPPPPQGNKKLCQSSISSPEKSDFITTHPWARKRMKLSIPYEYQSFNHHEDTDKNKYRAWNNFANTCLDEGSRQSEGFKVYAKNTKTQQGMSSNTSKDHFYGEQERSRFSTTLPVIEHAPETYFADTKGQTMPMEKDSLQTGIGIATKIDEDESIVYHNQKTSGLKISEPVGPYLNTTSAISYDKPSNVASTSNNLGQSNLLDKFPSYLNKPLEFSNAVSYVNKVKKHFEGQPEKYKKFLDILHTFRTSKNSKGLPPPLTSSRISESDVYAEVADLLDNQENLLQEFANFLPNSIITAKLVVDQLKPSKSVAKPAYRSQPQQTQATISRRLRIRKTQFVPTQKRRTVISKTKQSAMSHNVTNLKPKPSKKPEDPKELSLSEVAKNGSWTDFAYAFLDKVKSTLNNSKVFSDFLQCLAQFNEEKLSRPEVVNAVTPLFAKTPELLHWFNEFCKKSCYDLIDEIKVPVQFSQKAKQQHNEISKIQVEEIEYSALERIGTSYGILPKNHMSPICSGRTSLCEEVLNDFCVSHTISDDSGFVPPEQTEYEEYTCECEDNRFELDVVIESNALTIKTFTSLARKMDDMSSEELEEFKLDDYLGGSSATIHQGSVKRIYGDKMGMEIINGIKTHPSFVIPIALRRLKEKDEEWREAKKIFDRNWREEIEQLEYVDNQRKNFKQKATTGLIEAVRTLWLNYGSEELYKMYA